MPRLLAFGLLALPLASIVFALTHGSADGEEPAIRSDIVKEKNGDVFLTQTVRTKASLDKVWNAYATSEGWKSWVAPVAEVDFKIGGEADVVFDDGRTVGRGAPHIQGDDVVEIKLGSDRTACNHPTGRPGNSQVYRTIGSGGR